VPTFRAFVASKANLRAKPATVPSSRFPPEASSFERRTQTKGNLFAKPPATSFSVSFARSSSADMWAHGESPAVPGLADDG
jgi:hypothetical protein